MLAFNVVVNVYRWYVQNIQKSGTAEVPCVAQKVAPSAAAEIFKERVIVVDKYMEKVRAVKTNYYAVVRGWTSQKSAIFCAPRNAEERSKNEGGESENRWQEAFGRHERTTNNLLGFKTMVMMESAAYRKSFSLFLGAVQHSSAGIVS